LPRLPLSKEGEEIRKSAYRQREEKLLTRDMSKTFFGTDGIRGKANEFPLVPEFATKLARAVCEVVEIGDEESVVIGLDTRVSGVMLEAAMTSAFLAEGVSVHHLGVVSTPVTAFLTKETNAAAGIMITASHNPYEDNGIKIFNDDGYKLSDEQEEEIEEILEDDDAAISVGSVGLSLSVDQPEGLYFQKLLKLVEDVDFSGLKVVVDCANGATAFSAPQFLESLGMSVTAMAVEPDGKNINEECGAVHPEAAAKLVKEQGADLGVCFDGDGDRLIMIDEEGEVITGDRILCLSALAMKARGELKNDTLVATVMSNLGLRDALEAQGIKLETTGVGDKLVMERMIEGGYSLGGENSGHIIFGDYTTTGDGLLSALVVMAEVKKSGKKLSELANCMEEYPQQLTNLYVKDKPEIEDVPKLYTAIKEAEAALSSTGRTLVRYSGTENKIRVLVEAKTEDEVEIWSNHICKAVKKTIGA